MYRAYPVKASALPMGASCGQKAMPVETCDFRQASCVPFGSSDYAVWHMVGAVPGALIRFSREYLHAFWCLQINNSCACFQLVAEPPSRSELGMRSRGLAAAQNRHIMFAAYESDSQ